MASLIVEEDQSDADKRKEVRRELGRNKRLLDEKKDDLELDVMDLDASIKQALEKSGGKLTPGIKVLLQSKRSLVQQQAEIGISANNTKYLETRTTLDNSAASQARAISLMNQLNQGIASASGQAAVQRDFERYRQQTGTLRNMQGQLQDLMQADAKATSEAIERGSFAASSSGTSVDDLSPEERELFDQARREYMLEKIPDAEAVDVLSSLPSVPTELPSIDAAATSFSKANNLELSPDELSFL